MDWSKDGKFILYVEAGGATGQDLVALPLQGDKKPIPVVNTPFNEDGGAISPDGRWVAYRSNESGRYELDVQAFPGDGPKGRWQVSSSGVVGVRWRADGKELYFESADEQVIAAGIQSSAQGGRRVRSG